MCLFKSKNEFMGDKKPEVIRRVVSGASIRDLEAYVGCPVAGSTPVNSLSRLYVRTANSKCSNDGGASVAGPRRNNILSNGRGRTKSHVPARPGEIFSRLHEVVSNS